VAGWIFVLRALMKWPPKQSNLRNREGGGW